jgi:hypothetical protein
MIGKFLNSMICTDIEFPCRRVGGVSKVSGNFIAGMSAAYSMAATFVRLALRLRRQTHL